MNHKPLFLAVTLTALLVISGVFWVMQKRPVATNQPVAADPVVEISVQTEPENPIDTSDWKTYRNEEYGFEFKYPREWGVKEGNNKNIQFSVSVVSSEVARAFSEERISYSCDISVSYFSTVANYQESTDKQRIYSLNELVHNVYTITPLGPVEFGGSKDATEVILGGSGTNYSILAVHEGHLFQVFFCGKSSKALLDQTEKSFILNFRFISAR